MIDGFLAPTRLWLLVLPLLLLLTYIVLQRRRPANALRFSELELLASVVPRSAAWKRHVPAGLLLLSLVALTTAFARPQGEVEVPRERAVVVLALDVSLSMRATDVAPDRLTAAQDAASAFVEGLPDAFAVGLISFSGSATVVVPPSQDHAAVSTAVRELQLGPSTAIGEAVFASLDAIRSATAAAGGEQAPARIVLLSDGASTVGRPPPLAAEAAREADVPVSTIAFGTPAGTVDIDGQRVPVPVDGPTLARLATATGGTAFAAESGEELTDVYGDIGAQVGTTTELQEITATVTGLALALAVAAAAASLAWSSRLP